MSNINVQGQAPVPAQDNPPDTFFGQISKYQFSGESNAFSEDKASYSDRVGGSAYRHSLDRVENLSA